MVQLALDIRAELLAQLVTEQPRGRRRVIQVAQDRLELEIQIVVQPRDQLTPQGIFSFCHTSS